MRYATYSRIVVCFICSTRIVYFRLVNVTVSKVCYSSNTPESLASWMHVLVVWWFSTWYYLQILGNAIISTVQLPLIFSCVQAKSSSRPKWKVYTIYNGCYYTWDKNNNTCTSQCRKRNSIMCRDVKCYQLGRKFIRKGK